MGRKSRIGPTRHGNPKQLRKQRGRALKFIALKVENLFAYNGPSELNLSGTSPDKNIIIVSGRNGAGKTSLLNAAKLLFLGHENANLRRVGFAGQALTARQYVLGQPGRWFGIFNAASRASFASVALLWREGEEAWEARRTYRLTKNGSDFQEELLVSVDKRPLVPADAKTKLASMLPQEVVPFFFFDGEQIQALADAEIGREQAEIERLLGFSFYTLLTERIDAYAKEKARAGLPVDVQVKLVEAENSVREAKARAEAHGRGRIQEEENRLDFERTRDRLVADRERLRSGTLTDAERTRIEGRIKVLEGEREELALKLAESVPVEIPFLANQKLVHEAFTLLDSHLGRATDNSLAARLHRELPSRIILGLAGLDPPIVLSEMQSAALSVLFAQLLEELGIKLAPADPLLHSLSPKRAGELRDQFLLWSQKGQQDRGEQRDNLLRMRRISNDLRRINQELDEAELTTEEARTQYADLSEQIINIQDELATCIARIAELRISEEEALRTMQAQERRIADLEKEYEEVARENGAYKLAIRTKRAFERYREIRRRDVRSSVEARLNKTVEILLAPSELVRSITLSEDFVMTYYDERKKEVPRLSISAGMRQLLAMAMLWALKDEAEKPLPVIVDTPLGRMDRKNRNLLMTEYFPGAGDPLVLLPTDTELAPEDLDLLSVRVRRRYRIENIGGDSARIVEESAGRGGGL
jgi:DNA sulfur modification protein DndD